MKIQPLLYKAGCATCGAISTLPIYLIHTKVITNKLIVFKAKELKYMFLMCNLFAIQNTIFENLNFISNNGVRGACAAVSISPIVITLKIKKLKSRLNLDPNYKIFILITILREVIFYGLMYTLFHLNIKGMKVVGPIIANIISYPFKFIIIKYSYPILDIKFKNMKKGFIFEVFESSIGDVVALSLIYK